MKNNNLWLKIRSVSETASFWIITKCIHVQYKSFWTIFALTHVESLVTSYAFHFTI